MALKTTVKGTDRLSKKLRDLGIDVDKKLEQAAVAGALILQNGMKVRAPRLTGTLARSIHIGGHKDLATDHTNEGERTGAGVPAPEHTANGVKVFVGTDVEYAFAQEFGTENFPAQPYARPTVDEDGAEAKREVGAALRDIIRASVK